MRKRILPALLCTLTLLTACGGEEPLNWTPTPATPSPTPVSSSEDEAPWASLTLEDLPAALADPADLFSSDQPQVYLLGCELDEELYLYGLNDGYGGGILLRRGVDQITADGTTTTVVRHGATVVDDQTVEFTTRSLTEAAWSLGLGNKTCNLILKFDENNKCTLSTDTEGCTVSGTGEYVPHGEKNSFNNRDRDVIYLDYTVDLGDTKYATRDTLVMRDRQVKGEWFTVTKQ